MAQKLASKTVSDALQWEEQWLQPHAAHSKDYDCRRNDEAHGDYRLPYKRDLDRIIHSKAYARYVDKTQVVYLVDNDHISHRSLHVQLVSSFARGIASILRLNVDLVEAVALGHDVGHPPFGHEGEGYLSELSEQYGCGPFAHPWQSCRLLREIEPLNLGLAVYDGFLCHDGGMVGHVLKPHFGKTWKDHEQDLKNKITDPDTNIWPMTLEGCLVKICDTISYLARDIEDAVSLDIVSRDQLPDTLLGKSSESILRTVAQDIIRHSTGQEFIALSEEVYKALETIRSFNFAAIYMHPKLKVESMKIKRSYSILFGLLLEDFQKHGKNSFMWLESLQNKSPQYLESTPEVRLVIDYISGMTDGYFVRTLERFAIPRRIELL